MIKRLSAYLLALIMLLSFGACGEVNTVPESTETAGASPTESAKVVGQTVETAYWSLCYDPAVWVPQDDDSPIENDHRSVITLAIPDPEDDDEVLAWFRLRVMRTDHNNFRNNLRRMGFDPYEYAVNHGYKTVSIGGLDFLWHAEGEDTLYFTRVVSAGVDVELEISGDVSLKAVADVLGSLRFTVAEGDNTDPPWYWEGTPYAADPGSLTVGGYTLKSRQIFFPEEWITHENYDYNVAVAGDRVFVISGRELCGYDYDGENLTALGKYDLGGAYDYAEPAADGTVWCSSLKAPLIRWRDGKVLNSYKDAEKVAMHPEGNWGIGWFEGSVPVKLIFTEVGMTAEGLELPQLRAADYVTVDRGGTVFICGEAESDGMRKVFVFDEGMELLTVLESAESNALDDIIYATSTENGFFLLNGDMRWVLLYARDGSYLGKCSLGELCGTDSPWLCDAGLAGDGSILVFAVDERRDRSARELVVFRISGF